MHEIIVRDSQLLPDLLCAADETVALRGAKVDFMFRDLPREEDDSGWYFQNTEGPSNPHSRHLLDSIVKSNSDVLPLLNAPYFSAFMRDTSGNLIRDLEVEKDYGEERSEYEKGLQLVPVISEAFRDVSREDGTTLHESIARDLYDDCKAAKLLDTDSHWAEVDLLKSDFWPGGVGGMCFMDAKGFRYYLPVFMTFELKYSGMGNNFGLVFDLQKKGEDQFSDRFKILNQAQSVAVRKFLEYRKRGGDGDAAVALEQYWKQFKD